jgi:formylglycine-generating enzyme required for sulfatase activity
MFRANGFGVFDMLGNVFEWTEACYHDGYVGAPANGEVWTTETCDSRVLRGGSWDSVPVSTVRSADRSVRTPADRATSDGFRVARTLP